MKSQRKKLGCVLCLLVLAMFLPTCRGRTEEDLVRDFVARVARLAEKKDAAGLLACLNDDYEDFEGRTKTTTEAMVKDYFARYKGIVIHVLSTRIEKLDGPLASIETEAAVSSGAAEVFRKFVKLSLDNYRFNFRLIKTGSDWRIQSAEWKEIPLDQLYPESMIILKKIFRDL